MPNHYHLYVQTPDANISRCMRHIDGVYTQRFNRSHGYDGQLFRGRYKSILVDPHTYMLYLVRYIHRNPQWAVLVEKPAQYLWSSHRGYISKGKKWNWLHKSVVLSKFGRKKTDQISKFKEFVVERIYIISKRFFGIPSFFNFAIADGLYNLPFTDKTGILHNRETKPVKISNYPLILASIHKKMGKLLTTF